MEEIKKVKRNHEERAGHLFFARIGIALGLLCFLMAYLAFHSESEALITISAIFTVAGAITFFKGIGLFVEA